MHRLQTDKIRTKLQSSKLLILKGPSYAKKEEILDEVLANQTVIKINLSEKKEQKKYIVEGKFFMPEENAEYVVIQNAEFLPDLNGFIDEIMMGNIKGSTILTFSFEPQFDEILSEVLIQNELEITVFPPSFVEIAKDYSPVTIDSEMHNRLIYGNQTEAVEDKENAAKFLIDQLEEVLISQLDSKHRINKMQDLIRVLQLLAFGIGEHVSYNEIAEKAGLDNETVERYIDLLEKAYILIVLQSFYNEKRYELKKSHCIYFADNGLRNALIQNFNAPNFRNDMDALWKNWIVSERIKLLKTNHLSPKTYFWRTHTKQQIDYIEVWENETKAYQCDWQKKKPTKISASFEQNYPNIKKSIINKATYWAFLTRK